MSVFLVDLAVIFLTLKFRNLKKKCRIELKNCTHEEVSKSDPMSVTDDSFLLRITTIPYIYIYIQNKIQPINFFYNT